MLKVEKITDPKEFKKITTKFLHEKECENNLIIGILEYVIEGIYKTFYLHVVSKEIKGEKEIVFCALRTPPHETIFSIPNEKIGKEELEKSIEQYIVFAKKDFGEKYPSGGCIGEKEFTTLYTTKWNELTKKDGKGFETKLIMKQRIFKLALKDLKKPKHGLSEEYEYKFQYSKKDDPQVLEVIGDGKKEFPGEDRYSNEKILKEKKMYHLERIDKKTKKREIVTVVVDSRATKATRTVGWVFTPVKFRGKSYASHAVYFLSKQLLEKEGVEFTCLYTDLSNPISNSIYKYLGYKAVCDSSFYLKK